MVKANNASSNQRDGRASKGMHLLFADACGRTGVPGWALLCALLCALPTPANNGSVDCMKNEDEVVALSRSGKYKADGHCISGLSGRDMDSLGDEHERAPLGNPTIARLANDNALLLALVSSCNQTKDFLHFWRHWPAVVLASWHSWQSTKDRKAKT